jgi:hypothetical protein
VRNFVRRALKRIYLQLMKIEEAAISANADQVALIDALIIGAVKKIPFTAEDSGGVALLKMVHCECTLRLLNFPIMLTAPFQSHMDLAILLRQSVNKSGRIYLRIGWHEWECQRN